MENRLTPIVIHGAEATQTNRLIRQNDRRHRGHNSRHCEERSAAQELPGVVGAPDQQAAECHERMQRRREQQYQSGNQRPAPQHEIQPDQHQGDGKHARRHEIFLHVQDVLPAVADRHGHAVDQRQNAGRPIGNQCLHQPHHAPDQHRLARKIDHEKSDWQPKHEDQRRRDPGEKRVIILGAVAKKKIVGICSAFDPVENLYAVETRIVGDAGIRPGNRVGRQQNDEQHPRLFRQASEYVIRLGNPIRGEVKVHGRG